MNGILLIDKPKGWTSFDVVAKVRGMVKQATGTKRPKVGHAGTLDPLATGLLIILVGDYCKKAQEYSKLDKTYEVQLKLGETSTTDDAEGIISSKQYVASNKPSLREVESVIQGFMGEIQQTPPIYSAIKIDGKRAYKLAREGKQPEMKLRPVTIHSITNIDYKYPFISFKTEVSSGTYIRSLARDIGGKLDTGAYMTRLKRTTIGAFDLKQATQVENMLLDKIMKTDTI